MTEPRPPIPVTVIGGFLGAGKTSLLNHLIREGSGKRLGVLVNDFGSVAIDADLVVGVDGDMVSLAGGCICCSIREELSGALARLVELEQPPEHIVIEASGVSDPGALARAVEDPSWASVLQLDAAVVVVDAEHFTEAGLRDRIVTGGQLRAADLIVLNKVDLLEGPKREAAVGRLTKKYRRARVFEATHGVVPAAVVLDQSAALPAVESEPEPELHVELRDADEAAAPEHEHLSHAPHAEFITWTFRSGAPMGSRALRRVIENLDPSIYRVKGIVQLAGEPQHRAILHAVGRRAELRLDVAWGERTPATTLVFIARGHDFDRDALATRLAACEKSTAPLEGGGWSWLRRLWDGNEDATTRRTRR